MKILVVEDDKTVGQYVKRGLVEAGYHTDLVGEGDDGLRLASGGHYELLVLDLRLPRMSGLEVLRTLRDRGNSIPVLVLTAQDAVDFKVQALRMGADDYVTKPFALEELVARVRALLRRASPGDDEVLRFADLELDPGTREVRRGGDPIELTRTEFALLELFMTNPRQVLTRSIIFERVWGYDFGFASNSLDVYIGYLRRKTEAGGRPRLIQTVRGVGYALREV